MVQNPQPASTAISSTSKMSFAVALCAFAAAGVGLLINQWMSGWMAVGAMAGIGLFYAAIGVLNLHSTDAEFIDDDDLTVTSAHRLSGAANVGEKAVERRQESPAKTRDEQFANVRH